MASMVNSRKLFTLDQGCERICYQYCLNITPKLAYLTAAFTFVAESLTLVIVTKTQPSTLDQPIQQD
jgi:hypothetical protein